MDILKEAYEIVTLRNQEGDRRYGSFSNSIENTTNLFNTMSDVKLKPEHVFKVLIALKLARESYSHREDNLLDACAYIGALNNYINESMEVSEESPANPYAKEIAAKAISQKPTIKFFRESPDVKMPTRGTSKSAGIDFYLPEDLVIGPRDNEVTSLQIRAQIPAEYALVLFNKSGVCTKKSVTVGACVIDEDYTGLIHLHLFNHSDEAVCLEKGTKAVQGLLIPMTYAAIDEMFSVPSFETERGEGAFGSTGLK